jgi:hypothetical protein
MHAIRRAIDDGAMEIGGEYPAVATDSEGPLRQPQRLVELALRQQGERAQVIARRARRAHVAAGRVEAAGERVEQRDGAHRLGGVGVLLEPGPVEIGHRAPLPQQPRRLHDLLSRHAGDARHALRRILAAECRIALERRPARDDAAPRGDANTAKELRLLDVVHVLAGDRIVDDRPRGRRVPRNVAVRIAGEIEIGGGEESPRVVAHEERAVRPVADELAIPAALREHHAGQAERQRAVAPGSHAQPLIRLPPAPRAEDRRR